MKQILRRGTSGHYDRPAAEIKYSNIKTLSNTPQAHGLRPVGAPGVGALSLVPPPHKIPPSSPIAGPHSSRSDPMAAKTVCPITHKQFRDHAKPIEVVINGQTMTAPVKEFS